MIVCSSVCFWWSLVICVVNVVFVFFKFRRFGFIIFINKNKYFSKINIIYIVIVMLVVFLFEKLISKLNISCEFIKFSFIVFMIDYFLILLVKLL